ncbi:MAG: hypothetical protein H7A21_15395 [Spirochaetales bacterium]|nr:hypothetical protein [Spirochaetales bacterium]
MKARILSALGLCLLLSSNCILWYTGEPDPLAIHQPEAAPIASFPYTISSNDGELKLTLRQGLEATGVLSSPVEHYSLITYERGGGTDPLLLDVLVTEKKQGKIGSVWTFLTWYLTLGIVPSYIEDGMVIDYKLYRRTEAGQYQVRASQVYDTTRYGISWLGNVPLLWINLMTYSRGDIVALTAQDFIGQVADKGYITALRRPAHTERDHTVVLSGNRVFHSVGVVELVDTVTIVHPDDTVTIVGRDEVQSIL